MARDARETALALLAARKAGGTVCPSEVARALISENQTERAKPGWRGRMAEVHAAVDRLAAEGEVRLSWKGRALKARSGPYRIGRPAGR